MGQAAGFFTESGVQAILDALWPRVTTRLTDAENTVRKRPLARRNSLEGAVRRA